MPEANNNTVESCYGAFVVNLEHLCLQFFLMFVLLALSFFLYKYY